METKFILHGGFANHTNSKNDIFFKEILENTPDNSKILLICFAKPDNEVLFNKEKVIKQFQKNNINKKIKFELADEKNISEQIKKSDVIYLHGGITPKLLTVLQKIKNLRKLFNGKLIIGESAGAYVLSTCFYSKTESGLSLGLGFVPVKIICHYDGKDKQKLKSCSKDLELLLLPSYQYKVFEL